MPSARRRPVWLTSLLLVGCIPTPGFELPSATSDDPFETDGPYDPTVVPGDGTGGQGTDPETSSGAGTDDPSGPWDPSDPTSAGTTTASTGGGEASGSGGADTDGESGATTGAPLEDAFPPPGVFGDDSDEAGLVGTWTVSWNPDGTPHWSLAIAEDGSFSWSEAAASCSAVEDASGVLWVEGNELVMHVEAWDKREPWPVESVVGEPLVPPFRLHLSYAMAGGMLSVTGPWELTAMLGWEGRVFRRDAGFGPAGTWHSTAWLEAVLEGDSEPRVIARDVYTMETAGGAQAHETTQRTWSYGDAPVEQPPSTETNTWYNLTPGQPQGMISIGGITHLYDDTRLVAYDETRVFSEEPPAGCD